MTPPKQCMGTCLGTLPRTGRSTATLQSPPPPPPRLQIERFACLYTSHVANFLFYSPNKNYKARPDTMCHEDDLAA